MIKLLAWLMEGKVEIVNSTEQKVGASGTDFEFLVRPTMTVEPKRYVLPMAGTAEESMGGLPGHVYAYYDEHWTADFSQDQDAHFYTVTQKQIDSAPDWVKAIKPVEVTDDEQ